jgi:hypothetical protein
MERNLPGIRQISSNPRISLERSWRACVRVKIAGIREMRFATCRGPVYAARVFITKRTPSLKHFIAQTTTFLHDKFLNEKKE